MKLSLSRHVDILLLYIIVLQSLSECVEKRNCEEQVDKFLNDYCMSAAITPLSQSLEVQLSGQSSTCGPMVTVHAHLVSFLEPQ